MSFCDKKNPHWKVYDVYISIQNNVCMFVSCFHLHSSSIQGGNNTGKSNHRYQCPPLDAHLQHLCTAMYSFSLCRYLRLGCPAILSLDHLGDLLYQLGHPCFAAILLSYMSMISKYSVEQGWLGVVLFLPNVKPEYTSLVLSFLAKLQAKSSDKRGLELATLLALSLQNFGFC